ncbi:unnamed protein product, partial [marine sediment metagenome]
MVDTSELLQKTISLEKKIDKDGERLQELVRRANNLSQDEAEQEVPHVDGSANICPRCESLAEWLGYSCCESDMAFAEKDKILEYLCRNCGLIFKQATWAYQQAG